MAQVTEVTVTDYLKVSLNVASGNVMIMDTLTKKGNVIIVDLKELMHALELLG